MSTQPNGPYVANDLLGPRLTPDEVQSMAVACILTAHGACDYDPDCRCECHKESAK